ncbi:hypothetical protein AMIS_54940 [Actinoplanes missouriensis 431]|uniref:SalK n=1 Tax=Actinoplanes missouriensis (strain ATCC 14538 / DSM 43046 / CBS 188.64 / JCM 3121 / NBRC 102363 / NCIMB 12654 / NRRL B-3342 / UNCC 431) TaxID=512565 RepID=I0HCH7_ACTM4|nr:hypothetical protein [Actinoplanes missouriensis]BAL90714.1 hypothetical protein AMIS_54940 [Actinoplanes missouriensis 431]
MTESPYRLAWRVTEPIHAMVYFVPEAPEAYERAGLDDPNAGYFASRGAVFGACGPGIVAATFYNFNPALVAKVLPAVWAKTTPAAMLAARLEAAGAALTRGLGAATIAGPEVAEAAALARTAAEAAAAMPQGRPLFAAHAELPWPDEPHLVLFHAQMLLREFRGDGHVAALLAAEISGLEAIVLHVASGEIDERFLRGTRGWSRDAWAAAADGLRARGLLEGDGLSDAGRQLRAVIEERTDRLAESAYRVLGETGCLRLAELTRPMSRTLVKAGFLNPASLGSRRSV